MAHEITAGRMGRRAQAGGRSHPPADAHARRQAARLAGRPLRDAGAHGARPRARGRGVEVEADDQRPAPGARAAAKRVDRLVARARTASWTWRAIASCVARAGHDARDVRSQRPGRSVLAPGAGGRGRHRLRHARAGRDLRSTLTSRGAKCRSPASIPPTIAGQRQADGCRTRGLLQEQRGAVPGARAGQHRIRGARPRLGQEEHHRQRAGPQDLLRAERRAPRRQGGAPGQPHPDHRAQGRAGGRARQGQGQGGGTARGREEGAGQLRRGGEEEFAGPGVRAERRRPRFLRARRNDQGIRGRGLRPRTRARSAAWWRPSSATTSSR